MRFSMIAVSVLVSIAAASPIGSRTTSKEKAAAAAAASCPAVAEAAATSSTADAAASSSTATAAVAGAALTSSAYNDFQISGGSGGTAEADANALFASIDQADLASVSEEDRKIVQGIHDAAEDAEVGAFNPAIEAATGADADALGVGKIKNKVLKLTAEVLSLKIKGAKGDAASTTKAEEEQKKLTKNIATDAASAGKASTAVPFEASS